MELTDLKTFMTVVEKGGITRAAEELHRVPSSITTRILLLEEFLGVRLFVREGKRLLITSEGQTLYSYAARIAELVSEAERQVKSKTPGGKFRIGAMESTAALRLPKPLAELHAKYPRIQLELATGQSHRLYKGLLSNYYDAIFVTDVPVDDRLERIPAFEEELILITPKGHRPVKEPHDIQCKTLLSFKDVCFYRNRLIGWFKLFDTEPERVVELDSYNVILGGVAAGMGVGIVPAGILELFPDKSTVSVHRIKEPFGKATTELVWRKGIMPANIAALQSCIQSG